MNQVYQGGQYTARAVFRDSDDALTDPVSPKASAYDPTGTALFTAQDMVRDDLGQFHITFMVPVDAAVGVWNIIYTGTISAEPFLINDQFLALGSAAATIQAGLVTRVRLALGERIPVGGTEADTRFMDADIINAMSYNDSDFNKTMAELWLAKGGLWAELVDIAESGTDRSLSQMQRAALAQAKLYIEKVASDDSVWASTYRVIGESFHAYGDIPRPRWLWEPVTFRG